MIFLTLAMLPENSQLTQVYFSIFNILEERGIDTGVGI